MKFARTAGISLAAMTFACAAALGPAAAQTVEFWSPFTGPDGTAIDELVREFNAGAGAEAGVEVELLIIPWEQYYTNLVRRQMIWRNLVR